MDFTEKLRQAAEEKNSIVCLGIDPVLEKIPVKEQSPEKKIIKFFTEVVEATEKGISAAKPNYAYFAQYGFPGLRALKKAIIMCKNMKLPVILDAKRGDIGKSSEAYAKEVFEFWKADAVTVSPYMGTDSIEPFLRYAGRGKGTYVLVRTSNLGAKDFQDKGKLYLEVARKVAEWKTGAVIGATSLKELEEAAKIVNGPMLIPGVGAQGGSAEEAANVLRKYGDIKIHRINSSSGISYAYEKYGGNHAEAAAKAVKELNREIGKIV